MELPINREVAQKWPSADHTALNQKFGETVRVGKI